MTKNEFMSFVYENGPANVELFPDWLIDMGFAKELPNGDTLIFKGLYLTLVEMTQEDADSFFKMFAGRISS